MKVLAINGSPRAEGNTFQAMQEVGKGLARHNIDLEIVQVGHKLIHGCIGCGGCFKRKDGTCALPDDGMNELFSQVKGADGLLLGSPVYFSGIAGTLKCCLDRLFYMNGANGNTLRHKAGAAVVAVRRSGGMPTFDQLKYYLNYSEMIMPGSIYWNVIHGAMPGEVQQDGEGLQVMDVLGDNMGYLMRSLEAAAGTVNPPEKQKKVRTNFIR